MISTPPTNDSEQWLDEILSECQSYIDDDAIKLKARREASRKILTHLDHATTAADEELRKEITNIIVSIIQLPRGKTVDPELYSNDIFRLIQADRLLWLERVIPEKHTLEHHTKPIRYIGTPCLSEFDEGFNEAIEQIKKEAEI